MFLESNRCTRFRSKPIEKANPRLVLIIVRFGLLMRDTIIRYGFGFRWAWRSLTTRRRLMLNFCSYQRCLLWLSSLTSASLKRSLSSGFRSLKPIVWYASFSFYLFCNHQRIAIFNCLFQDSYIVYLCFLRKERLLLDANG